MGEKDKGLAARVAAHKQRKIQAGYRRVSVYLSKTTVADLDDMVSGTSGRAEIIEQAIALLKRQTRA